MLLDTGPLVAFLNRRDRYHRWAEARLAEVQPPLKTCESVLSEACFLLRELGGGPDAVMSLVDRGLIAVSLRLADECARVQRLLRRYEDQSMSLADACLVRMSELIPDSAVMTLDADFRVYRRHGRGVIPVIVPTHSR